MIGVVGLFCSLCVVATWPPVVAVPVFGPVVAVVAVAVAIPFACSRVVRPLIRWLVCLFACLRCIYTIYLPSN